MKHHTLHDLAKFGAGLILGDFLCGWWFYAYHLFPVTFLGVTLTETMIVPWLIFDAAVFFMLIHYGWNIGETPHLKSRSFLNIVGIIFGLVALAHLIRLFFGVDIMLGVLSVPLWLSWIGVAVTTYLSYMSFYLAAKFE